MRRAQMEARIQRNMAQAVKMEEKRKEHFWEKKAHHEALRHDLGVLWCLHFIQTTRVHLTMTWVVLFSTLSAFRARSRLDMYHTQARAARAHGARAVIESSSKYLAGAAVSYDPQCY